MTEGGKWVAKGYNTHTWLELLALCGRRTVSVMIESGVRGRWIEDGAGGRRLYVSIGAIERVHRLF